MVCGGITIGMPRGTAVVVLGDAVQWSTCCAGGRCSCPSEEARGGVNAGERVGVNEGERVGVNAGERVGVNAGERVGVNAGVPNAGEPSAGLLLATVIPGARGLGLGNDGFHMFL